MEEQTRSHGQSGLWKENENRLEEMTAHKHGFRSMRKSSSRATHRRAMSQRSLRSAKWDFNTTSS